LVRHEAIAYDWLAQGGKRSRRSSRSRLTTRLKRRSGTRSVETLDLPDGVRRAALAIEAFHKASLVHDDIEDDDSFRYGIRRCTASTASARRSTSADYLIGLAIAWSAGRRGTWRRCCRRTSWTASDAHLKLAEGQGAELLWREAATSGDRSRSLKDLRPQAAPRSMRHLLRTAARGPAEQYEKMVAEFSRTSASRSRCSRSEGLDRGEATRWSPARTCSPAADAAAGPGGGVKGLAGADREELLSLFPS